MPYSVSSSARSALVFAVFAGSVLLAAHVADRWDLAVYALSFWHYLVYMLAFWFRQIPQDRFKFDAVLLKTVSLIFFAMVVLQTVPGVFTLTVMAAGFALNTAAAAQLGIDRTYYGVELAGLPVKWVTAFPYSIMSHPMLLGSVVAYGGALFDAEFRDIWWPLAVIHMLLNVLIIAVEAHGSVDRTRALALVWCGLGAGGALLLMGFTDAWLAALACSAMILTYGGVLISQYAGPTDGEDQGRSWNDH